MSHDFEVRCARCKMAVEHICNESFKKALIDLLRWVPEGAFASEEMERAFRDESGRQDAAAPSSPDGFLSQPFFGSQAWTYLLWHKEDARSFHGYLNNLMRAAGLDPHELTEEAYKVDSRGRRRKS